MATIASIDIAITASTDRFDSKLRSTGTKVRVFASDAQSNFTKMRSAISSVGAALGGISLIALTKQSISLAAAWEQTATSIQVLTGNAVMAESLLEDLQSFAATTPFQMDELADASRSLLAFGFAADDIIPRMRQLGNLASGLNIPVGELSEIYGKARVQGRLFMEDINQLTGRGIPVIQEFAKQFGVAESEVRKLVEQGRIGFESLDTAIASMTTGGGQFAGMTERLAETMGGKLSTATDRWETALRKLGSRLAPLVNLLSDFAEAFGEGDNTGIRAMDAMMGGGRTANAANLGTNAIAERLEENRAQLDEFAKKREELGTSLSGSIFNIGGGSAELEQLDNAIDTLRHEGSILRAMLQRSRGMPFSSANLQESVSGGIGRLASSAQSTLAPHLSNLQQIGMPALGGLKTAAEKLDELITPTWQGLLKAMPLEMPETVAKEAESAAERIIAATRTPIENFQSDMESAFSLFNQGLLDSDTLQRFFEQGREQLESMMPQTELMDTSVGAAEMGSREAFSTIARAANQRTVSNDPNESTARNTARTNEILARMERLLGEQTVVTF